MTSDQLDGLTHQVRALLEALAALVTTVAGGAAEAAAAAAALSAHKPAKGGGGKGGNKSLGALLAQAIGAAGGEGGKGGASGEDQGTTWLTLWKPTVVAHHGALDQAASLLLDAKLGLTRLADAPTDTARRADLWEDAAGVVVAMVLEAAPAASMAADEVLACIDAIVPTTPTAAMELWTPLQVPIGGNVMARCLREPLIASDGH